MLCSIDVFRYRRRHPGDWTDDHQLVLRAATQYAAWCRDCDKPRVSYPADLDKMAQGYADYVKIVREMRTTFAGAGNLDEELDNPNPNGGAPAPRSSTRFRNAHAVTSSLHERIKPGDPMEYRCRTNDVTYVGWVGDTVNAREIEFVCDDDDTAPNQTTVTVVPCRDFKDLDPITDGIKRRALWVRQKFSQHDITPEDVEQMGNGFKVRTAGYTALMVLYHGATYLSDSGVREATNKLIKGFYNCTNKRRNKFMATLAENVVAHDKEMLLERATAAKADPKPRRSTFTLASSSSPRLTGRGGGTHRVLVKADEMKRYRAALKRHESGSIRLNFDGDKVMWTGRTDKTSGEAPILDRLRAAIGVYEVTVAVETVSDEDTSAVESSGRRLRQRRSSSWLLVQADASAGVDGLELRWDEGVDGGDHKLVAAVKVTKGGIWLVFKQPRSYMIAQGLISGGEAEKGGTAKAKVSAEVGIPELPELPPSAAPPKVPRGLAALVSRWHRNKGDMDEQYGPAEIRLHTSAASTRGKISATANWQKTGRPRLTVATHEGKHVLVKALFRSRRAYTDPFQELAQVTPLTAVPLNSASGSAVWLDLGLVLLEVAGRDKLVPVAGLNKVLGYATPVPGGDTVKAAVAPWVGLRSATERGDEDDDDDDE